MGANNRNYLSNSPGVIAGHNQIINNPTAIMLQGMAYIDLFDGYNDLRSNPYCLSGNALANYVQRPINCQHNYWKTGGGAPVQNVDYVLTGTGGAAFTIEDYSPQSYIPPCAPVRGQSSANTYTEFTFENTSYRTVTIGLGNEPINVVVEKILNTNAKKGTIYSVDARFEMLVQLLSNDLSNLNAGEERYAQHSYQMLKSLLGKLERPKGVNTLDATKTQKIIQVMHKLQTDDNQKNGNVASKKHNANYFALAMDEAQIRWLTEDYDGATALLQKLLKKADADQACEIKKLLCEISGYRDFIASNNTLELEERLAQCTECNGTQKSGSLNPDDYPESSQLEVTENPTKPTSLELNLGVVPNPVTGTSEIRVFGLQQPATMVVFNSNGAKVINETITTQTYTRLVSNTELPAGLYLITLNQNDTTIQTMKMVVVK